MAQGHQVGSSGNTRLPLITQVSATCLIGRHQLTEHHYPAQSARGLETVCYNDSSTWSTSSPGRDNGHRHNSSHMVGTEILAADVY